MCVWNSVTKSLFVQHAGGPRAHHTARANEALYDEARKRYLQTSSWVLACTAGLVTFYAAFMSPVAMYSCKSNTQESAWSPDWPWNPRKYGTGIGLNRPRCFTCSGLYASCCCKVSLQVLTFVRSDGTTGFAILRPRFQL